MINPRPDIAKCNGANLECCEKCTRKLSEVGIKQTWTEPSFNAHGDCVLFADIAKYE